MSESCGRNSSISISIHLAYCLRSCDAGGLRPRQSVLAMACLQCEYPRVFFAHVFRLLCIACFLHLKNCQAIATTTTSTTMRIMHISHLILLSDVDIHYIQY